VCSARARVSIRLSWSSPSICRWTLPLLDPWQNQLVQVDNGRAISLHSAVHDAAFQSVTLRPETRLLPGQTYSLTVIGTPPGGLTTSVGAFLAGDGPPGSNFVATIT
jgi:hypothetical protein